VLAALPIYLLFILAVIVSMVISIYTVRKTLFITRRMKIYDVPDKIRKIHGAGIPSLGGIGIFTGYTIVAVFFWPRHHFFMPAVMASSFILFFAGIYDDLVNMSPSKKLIAQVLSALITAYFADIRIDPYLQVFGVGAIPYWLSLGITTLCCTFFINVFNFIDGIDGLACVLAIMYLGILGLLFAGSGHAAIAGMTFALMGATAGLLVFNFAPAKIYMGDTGSMFLGFTIFNFSLLFVNWCYTHDVDNATLPVFGAQNSMMLMMAMLIMPVYDGIRVFVLRASKGISPLKADRAHLHYYLLDAGATHSQAVFIIVVINLLVIGLAWLLRGMNPGIILGSMVLMVSVMVFIIYKMRQKHLAKAHSLS
jgi:UDP-GlcNAc:undecaprenyl-phosphate/decaprenyl-phosphate GlcNAc-1-phosphate transferase